MLVTVHRELNFLHARIVCHLLRSEGLAASLHAENHIRMAFHIALAAGQVQVQVPRAQLEQAQQVLSDWRQGRFEAALEAEQNLPPDLCPQCGARDWRYTRWRLLPSALWVFGCMGLNMVLPPPITGRRCGRCGQRQPLPGGDNAAPAQPEHHP